MIDNPTDGQSLHALNVKTYLLGNDVELDYMKTNGIRRDIRNTMRHLPDNNNACLTVDLSSNNDNVALDMVQSDVFSDTTNFNDNEDTKHNCAVRYGASSDDMMKSSTHNNDVHDNKLTNVRSTPIVNATTTNTVSISIEGNINDLNTGSVSSQNTGSTYITNSDMTRYTYHINHRSDPSYVLQPIIEHNDSTMVFSGNRIQSRNNDMGTRQTSDDNNSTTTLMNIKQLGDCVRVDFGISFERIEEFNTTTTTSDSPKDLHILKLGLDYSISIRHFIDYGCYLLQLLTIGYTTVLATVIDLSCLIYCSHLTFWITNANHRGVSRNHGYGFGLVLISVRHEARSRE